jgi:uncharacterized membrane protein
MRVLQTVVLMTATISAAGIAGLFYAFSCSVMPGLARSSDHTFVETMRNINRAILNPWFLLPFLGSIPLIALAVLLAWAGQGRPALPWLIAALVVYGVAFLITMVVNVPLNVALEAAGDPGHITDLAAVRARFEDRWARWNTIRAIVHTAAFGLLAWALVVYGAHSTADV